VTELNFKGKEFVYNHHLAVPFRPLLPQPKKGIGPVSLDGNLIIHGDNLHALKALLPLYSGKVDCIFIDPPYNTGEEGWCYNDNVNSPMIKEWLASNPVSVEDGLRHDKWCAMMWPRLRLLRELLSDSGFLFVCIDKNESHHLRSMLEEIFGEENFRNEIIIRRGVKNVQSQFEDIDSLSVGHDTLYLFSKRPDVRLPKLMALSDEDEPGKWDTFWRGTDRETMRYPLFGKTPDHGQWRWKKSRALIAKQNYEEYLAEFADKLSLDEFYHLRTQEIGSDCDFVRLNEDGTVQYYVPPRNYKLMSDVWMRLATAGRFTSFPHEKSLELVETAVRWVTKKNSIVLDSFAGSGSTGHAVLSANAKDQGTRTFILVEMEDYAEKTTAERIREAIRSDATNEDMLPLVGENYFTYCSLGEAVDLDRILKGETLPDYDALGSVLFHMATSEAFEPKRMKEKQYYLGESTAYHVWLIYKPDLDWLKSPEAALTLSRARQFAEAKTGKRHLVFAPSRHVSQKMLDEQNIPVEFVSLPFALYRIMRE